MESTLYEDVKCTDFLITEYNCKQRIIKISNINFFQKISGRELAINTNELEIITKNTLKNIWDIVDNKGTFFRSHKSFIINIAQIMSVYKSNSYYVVNFKKTDKKALISRYNKKFFDQLIIKI